MPLKRDPNHFVDWVMGQEAYATKNRTVVANAILPRYVYDRYLQEAWKENEVLQKEKGIRVDVMMPK